MHFSDSIASPLQVWPRATPVKEFLRAACLALLLLWSLSCSARDHIVDRAWTEDAGGHLTLQEVRQLPLQSFQGVLSRGFGHSVIWIRLRIDPTAGQAVSRDADHLVLRIRPVYLDEIQVFDPLADDGLVGVTGDRIHPRGQAFEGLDFLLPIARGNAPRDIWLRFSSTSTRQISVQAVTFEDLQRQTQIQQMMYGLYIGVILIFMVWGLVHWVFSRERVIGAFGLKQAAALVFALGSLGYTRVFWPNSWPAQWLDATTSVFSILAVSAAIYFHLVLLSEISPPRWLSRVHQLMLALLPVKLLLLVADEPTLALGINMGEVLLGPVIFLLSVLLAKGWSQQGPGHPQPLLGRWVVVGFYALFLLILLVAALPGLGLSEGGEVPLYLVQAHGLLTAFLILLMLQYRAHLQQKQQRETALALERSQLQAQQERGIREEQEKLLAMLAHELRTPLATMHMRLDASAQGSGEIRQAIRDMNAVIERCQQTTQLSDRQLKAQMASVDLVGVVRDTVSGCAQPGRIQMSLPSQLNVQTDRQLMFIVLNNLLENACKYAAPDSPITLRLTGVTDPENGATRACIEVANQPGPAGWPDADRLFSKYYRSPHARRQAGTGLGLYLVKNLMQVLGGHIDYRPDADQVRFMVCLPCDTAVQ